MTDTEAGTPPREARNALLRTLQDEGIVGRKRQRIEDAADRFATATLDAARSRPATDPAGLIRDLARRAGYIKAGEAMIREYERLAVADGPGPEERLRAALAEWDAIEGSSLFRAIIAAGKMADAIRAALSGEEPTSRG